MPLLGLLKPTLELDSVHGWRGPRRGGGHSQACPQWVELGVPVVSRLGAYGQQAGCLALQLTPLPATSPDLAGKRQNQQGGHSHGAWAQAGTFLVVSVALTGSRESLTFSPLLRKPLLRSDSMWTSHV